MVSQPGRQGKERCRQRGGVTNGRPPIRVCRREIRAVATYGIAASDRLASFTPNELALSNQ